MPWSTTVIRQRSPPSPACTSTNRSGGEKDVAFSSSSAMSSTRSATSRGDTVTSAIGAEPDRPEALDLAHRGPDRRGQRQRLRAVALVRGACHDHQAVGGAPEAGGHVVDPVETGEQVRVGLVALQLLDHAQLPADQVLGAPPDAGEHRGDVAPAHQLAFQQQHGGGLDPVERRRQLADLVLRADVDRGQPRRLPLGILVVRDPQQLGVGEVGHRRRGQRQPSQWPGDRSRHRDDQPYDQREQPHRDGGHRDRGGHRFRGRGSRHRC